MKKTLVEIHEDVPADHYDKGFKNNAWQRIWHRRRIDEIEKISPAQLENILDVGCHSGFMTKQILVGHRYKKLHGIDISPDAISLAKRRIKKGVFSVGDVHKLPFKNNSFDTVYCLEVLEHVEDPQRVIAEIKRVLKKNGEVIILVPTDNLLFKCIWYAWNILYPVWKHAHIQSFKSNSLLDLLKEQGFTVEEIKKFNLDMLLLARASKK